MHSSTSIKRFSFDVIMHENAQWWTKTAMYSLLVNWWQKTFWRTYEIRCLKKERERETNDVHHSFSWMFVVKLVLVTCGECSDVHEVRLLSDWLTMPIQLLTLESLARYQPPGIVLRDKSRPSRDIDRSQVAFDDLQYIIENKSVR